MLPLFSTAGVLVSDRLTTVVEERLEVPADWFPEELAPERWVTVEVDLLDVVVVVPADCLVEDASEADLLLPLLPEDTVDALSG